MVTYRPSIRSLGLLTGLVTPDEGAFSAGAILPESAIVYPMRGFPHRGTKYERQPQGGMSCNPVCTSFRISVATLVVKDVAPHL